MRKTFSTRLTGALFVAVVLLLASAIGRTQGSQEPPVQRFVADELLVEFEPWANDRTRAAVRQLVGAALQARVKGNALGQLERVRIPSNVNVAAAIGVLRSHAAVRFAEPNWVYIHQATSNDPGYVQGYLWGLLGNGTSPANANGSQAGEAWTAGAIGSHSVYVGIIDEGLDLNHVDLAANVWSNPFDPPDGVDNDGNGYVDDVHGWDFFQDNNSIYDGGPGNTTLDSHGTHVAGTIGAVGGNGVGIAGVNWNVTMISAKFLGPNGGTTADAVAALNYLTDLRLRHGLNIVATNNSWGGGGYSQALHDAILRAAKAGILFVAAAGNGNVLGVGQNNDTTPAYPSNYTTLTGTSTEPAATYEAVIAVASLTSSGGRSTFSNYGAATVDLGAPGSAIWSTTPSGSYSQFSGTSMATPHVSGAAALYSAANPLATAEEIRSAILQSASATPTASMAGITVTGGRLNIGYWFTGTPTPPEPPSGLVATAISPSQINLGWTDNSANEDGFAIERCQGATCTNFVQIITVGPGVATYPNTGLASSTTFRYRVRAFNGAGNSTYSNIGMATTQAAPGPPAAPSNLIATAGPGSGQITLTWQDNSTNESGFRIVRCGPTSCTTATQVGQVGPGVVTFVDTTVVPGGFYQYGVRAFNASGVSAYSNPGGATAPQ